MFLSWSMMLTTVALLAMKQCAGESSCDLWSSAGAVVQLGSTFTVFCTFNPTCKISGTMQMCGNGCSKSLHKKFNKTTISLRVENITEKRTYSCSSECNPPLDSCGLDILAGYPPDQPKSISCIYRILKNDTGIVNCSWDKGRETHLWNRFVVWVTTVNETNHTTEPVPMWNTSYKGTESPFANFTLLRSVWFMSVWVQANNSLGSAESSVVSYNLSDIVMPSTVLVDQVECSSRNCTIKVEQPVRTQHLQIQYRDQKHQEWKTYPDFTGVVISSKTNRISSLKPCTLYSFRARSRFTTGLWSQWSLTISNWTKEEALPKALDVWLAPGPDFKCMRVYWNVSAMSACIVGSIIRYMIRVNGNNLSVTTNVSADVKSLSLPFCTDCEVTVQALNSEGSSPTSTITTLHTKAKPLLDIQPYCSYHNVTISWKKDETAPAYYVVEWYGEGHMLSELRWVRLDRNQTFVTLTDIKPWECYEGAVYVFYNGSSVRRTSFKQIATLEAVPEMGPSVHVTPNKPVTIVWNELPREKRMGCIKNFTIYLRNNQGELISSPTVQASLRAFTIQDLPPGHYSVRISASTSKGEGPLGQMFKFNIEEDDHISLVLMVILIILMLMFTLCFWKSSTVKHWFKEIFHCLMPDVVPDPANSKWAKECIKERGKMNLQLPSHNTSFTGPQDKTILVDVEELCREISDSSTPKHNSSQFCPESSLGQETELSALLYPPLTAYIKSLSHDSDSSGHTQASLDTNTTIDYISSHGQENPDNYDQDEEEEFPEMQFFPSLSLLMEPVGFGGKLTLDAVKIDCSDFFQNAKEGP